MKIRIKKRNLICYINMFLFISIFALRSFTDGIFIARGIESNIWINLKYIVILIAIMFGVLQLKNKKEKCFKHESKEISVCVFLLSIISIFFMIYNAHICKATLQEVFKLILPIIYVYVILNILDFDDIYSCMCWILIFSIIGYIIEIGLSKFSLANIIMMSFKSSYSPFESSYACGTAIAMCTFFMYYRKNKLFQYISFAFAIFTFKRLSVVFAVILLVLPKFYNVNNNVNKNVKTIIKIIFICATIGYINLLSADNSILFEKIFKESQSQFTMGRSEFLNILYSNNFKSYGLGSTTDFLGYGLEMDLIRILLETSIIGLIIFINAYWNVSGTTVYTNLYMLFQFTNLLTSHSLSNSFNWILVFVTIGTITYKKKQEIKYFKIKGRKEKNEESSNMYN